MISEEDFLHRRSHYPKEMTGEKIGDEIILELLKNAHTAPSHKLTLPWKFIVLSNEKLLTWNEEVLQHIPITDDSEILITKAKKIPSQISHAIVIICRYSGKVPAWEEIASVGAAVQNMYLTLNNYGDIGGYWTTGSLTNSDAMRNYFSLAENEQHVGNFFIGKLIQKRTQSERKNFMEHVIWEK